VKTIFKLLPIGLAVGLCACAPAYTFSPWVGAQQNWSTGQGGYVKMVDNVPIYAPGQYPPRPYVILGAVHTDSEENLAKAAREHHADAALLSTERTVQTGSVVWAAPGVVAAQPITSTAITANLIAYH
jgi:hypothetical protein